MSSLVEIPVVVTPKTKRLIPYGSRIVITDIAGECAEEVKEAVMRRLIDNTNYSILARDHLEQIFIEKDLVWGGAFNTLTAVKIGELLGASLFIVGRVNYCGTPANDSLEFDPGSELTILAALQIIDLETGKVILSSASEGNYVPETPPLLVEKEVIEGLVPSEIAKTKGGKGAFVDKFMEAMKSRMIVAGGATGVAVESRVSSDSESEEEKKKEEEENAHRDYPRVKAAEDLANGFANKFFARPAWESVEMWKSPRWHYGDSVRYVKLGQCPKAVESLESIAAQELPNMSEIDIANFLHNYGVALLCANDPEQAMRKLRSAYRISYDTSTLKMLAFAGRIIEWNLDVEVDSEPETGVLLDRSVAAFEKPADAVSSSGAAPVSP